MLSQCSSIPSHSKTEKKNNEQRGVGVRVYMNTCVHVSVRACLCVCICQCCYKLMWTQSVSKLYSATRRAIIQKIKVRHSCDQGDPRKHLTFHSPLDDFPQGGGFQ